MNWAALTGTASDCAISGSAGRYRSVVIGWIPSSSDSTTTTTPGGIVARSPATTDGLADIRARVADASPATAPHPGCRTAPRPRKCLLSRRKAGNIIQCFLTTSAC